MKPFTLHSCPCSLHYQLLITPILWAHNLITLSLHFSVSRQHRVHFHSTHAHRRFQKLQHSFRGWEWMGWVSGMHQRRELTVSSEQLARWSRDDAQRTTWSMLQCRKSTSKGAHCQAARTQARSYESWVIIEWRRVIIEWRRSDYRVTKSDYRVTKRAGVLSTEQ